MPAFACIVVVFGLIKKVPVFDVFISGAKEGVKLLYNIAPTIMGLVFAVDLLQSSGAIDAICSLIQPTAEFLGFPKEIVPLVLLRPVSGSGSTALLTALYKTCRSRQLCGQNSLRTRRFKRNNLLRNCNVLWLYPCQKNSPHPLCRHNRRPNRRNHECYNGQIVV